MDAPNDENDNAKGIGGTVAGRAATVVENRPKPASAGAAADEQAADGKEQGTET